MPKPRKSEIIRCSYFAWRLINRQGVWYADGRSNTPSAGRHSLGSSDRNEALRLLPQLDRVRAEQLGLAQPSPPSIDLAQPLSIHGGRKLYEEHISRPRVTGGVRTSTQKRYRTVFDKFARFTGARGIGVWNTVTAAVLTGYASDLQTQGYAHKSIVNELTTLKQAIKWMIEQGHLGGMEPVKLKLRKAESESAYCYRPAEIRAMIEYSRADETLDWLGNVIVALACTGLRIAELTQLRWSDLDLSTGRLQLTDETGRSSTADGQRRELKSGRSRSFPIHADLLAVFQELPRSDGYVFHGPRGGRLKPDTVRRILVRDVIRPLTERFPTPEGERGFRDGRLHSFRHAFCSTCANDGVPERMLMEWLGHSNSELIRHYYHLYDAEARRRMDQLDFLGGAGRRSAGNNEDKLGKEDVGPTSSGEAMSD
jgi:integrase